MHQLNSSCTFFISCVDLYPSMSLGPLPCDRGRQLLKGTACISVSPRPPFFHPPTHCCFPSEGLARQVERGLLGAFVSLIICLLSGIELCHRFLFEVNGLLLSTKTAGWASPVKKYSSPFFHYSYI